MPPVPGIAYKELRIRQRRLLTNAQLVQRTLQQARREASLHPSSFKMGSREGRRQVSEWAMEMETRQAVLMWLIAWRLPVAAHWSSSAEGSAVHTGRRWTGSCRTTVTSTSAYDEILALACWLLQHAGYRHRKKLEELFSFWTPLARFRSRTRRGIWNAPPFLVNSRAWLASSS